LTVRNDIETLVWRALEEDIGAGDITTQALVAPDVQAVGRFVAKGEGIVAGWEVVRTAFRLIDERVNLQPKVMDGERARANDVLAWVSGPVRALLSAERTALNFLQRMSGIATRTRLFVEAVKGTAAVILDTRKTAPGLRMLDKMAVRIGGGENHRFGLDDMVLIKENHIVAAGGLERAVDLARKGRRNGVLIEVEVRDLEELRRALKLEVDRILLDNMSVQQLREAVQIADYRIPLEASGGVTLDNVAEVAATGVDFISVGELTHSVRALDISLLIDHEKA